MRALREEEMRQLVAQAKWASICTVDESGAPYAIEATPFLMDDSVCFMISPRGGTFRNMAGNDRVLLKSGARPGDALVLSRATERLARRAGDDRKGGAPDSIIAETDAMARTVERMMAGRAPVIRASVPFGEDLGFMLAGVPALTVTVLPRAEAEALAGLSELPAWASPSEPGSMAPATWRRIHGPEDTPALFTDDAFDLVSRFLQRLAALRVPASVA